MRRLRRKQQSIDTRPLDQRYKAGDPKEIHKGMNQVTEVVNRSWLEKQQKLF
mgnify:CR=1 FL=1